MLIKDYFISVMF